MNIDQILATLALIAGGVGTFTSNVQAVGIGVVLLAITALTPV